MSRENLYHQSNMQSPRWSPRRWLWCIYFVSLVLEPTFCSLLILSSVFWKLVGVHRSVEIWLNWYFFFPQQWKAEKLRGRIVKLRGRIVLWKNCLVLQRSSFLGISGPTEATKQGLIFSRESGFLMDLPLWEMDGTRDLCLSLQLSAHLMKYFT